MILADTIVYKVLASGLGKYCVLLSHMVSGGLPGTLTAMRSSIVSHRNPNSDLQCRPSIRLFILSYLRHRKTTRSRHSLHSLFGASMCRDPTRGLRVVLE